MSTNFCRWEINTPMARNRYVKLAFFWKDWRMRKKRHPVQPFPGHFQRLSCKWRDTELLVQPVVSLMNSECQTRWTLILSVIGASLEASRAKMKFQSYGVLRETDKKESVWAELLGLCRKLKADLFFPPSLIALLVVIRFQFFCIYPEQLRPSNTLIQDDTYIGQRFRYIHVLSFNYADITVFL